MLSYQHSYHAGSYADLIKHILLARTLAYLGQKESPLFYLETHGGRGQYDLYCPEALKTKEADGGIKILWTLKQEAPQICNPFFQCIEDLNPDRELKLYPGSPAIALKLLRQTDRLYIHERHPQEFLHLKSLKKQHKRVFYAQADGIENLKALLPPVEKRILVFIDPSYEIKQEYESIPKAIQKAYQRSPNATFMLWYPIIHPDLHKRLMHGLHKIPSTKNLRIEFDNNPSEIQGMHGCGLWIINPPYVLEQESKGLLSFLKQHLGTKKTEILIEQPEVKPTRSR